MLSVSHLKKKTSKRASLQHTHFDMKLVSVKAYIGTNKNITSATVSGFKVLKSAA